MPRRPPAPRFAERFRELLAERDVSYRALAARTFCGKSYLQELAAGKKTPSPKVARARRFYLGGMRAGHAAHDDANAANNLSSLSYLLANVGDRREATTLARSAYAVAGALRGLPVAVVAVRVGDRPAAGRTQGR